jgi:hypothetical protein
MVTFELALADETVASVEANLAKYQRAIADSLEGVEPSQVELTVKSSRRLRRLLAGVTLEVTIKTTTTGSADSITHAVATASFVSTLSTEMGEEGITSTVTVDTTTISTSMLVSLRTNAEINLSDPSIRSVGSATISLRAEGGIPSDGHLVITFDGFGGLSAVSVDPSRTSGISGSLTVAVEGLVVTLSRSGGGLTVTEGTAVEITLTGITNPSAVGVAPAHNITTLTGGGGGDRKNVRSRHAD